MTTTATGTTCAQPGCGGTITDGYCDTCGLAATSGPTGPRTGAGGGTSGTSRSTSTPSRRSRPTSGPSARGHLGAGLIEIPPVPARDPASAVLADPQVPENKRFCGACDRPVGRSRDGRPGLADGFCPNCGTQFSFTPKLAPGDMVAGQYEVLGCMAHGGLGWIYLAMDHNLGKRWVVLKGLLNSGDVAAQEAAIAERRFLAEVEHPSIVGVYNFVQHDGAGYIVMEYVGGQSLRQLLAERRRAGESLPLPVALAYMIEILPALGYLHGRGLVYCDFKPDNVIQTEEQLKLIDMGGVRRIDDTEGAIYGTVGYQAPEIADDGPTPSSDLYTVGRALAVLTFEFTGYQSTFRSSLPDPAAVPMLREHESFYRALRRATHAEPVRRFTDAAEMASQLTGVLREVLCTADQQPRPAFSLLFSPEPQAVGVPLLLSDSAPPLPGPTAAEIAAGLPVPSTDPADPAANYLAALASLDPSQLVATLATGGLAGQAAVPAAVAGSVEVLFALARGNILSGNPTAAMDALASVAAEDDWRATWYRGLADLASADWAGARAAFDAVCDELPGELAPKLALAFATEGTGDNAVAARYFQVVWAVDRSFVSAAFGLARTRLRAGEREAAIDALTSVPRASAHHAASRVAAIRIRVAASDGRRVASAADLRAADRTLGELSLDESATEHVTAEVLRAALARVVAGEQLDAGELLGCQPNERALRFGLERCYRAQARLASGRVRRTRLVDLANEVRPRTWT